jgi:hypothetical protein
MQFDREMRRRSFWASWCGLALLNADRLASVPAFDEIVNSSLPAKLHPAGSIRGIDITPNGVLSSDENWSLSESSDPAPSFRADLDRLLRAWQALLIPFWGSAYDHIRRTKACELVLQEYSLKCLAPWHMPSSLDRMPPEHLLV